MHGSRESVAELVQGIVGGIESTGNSEVAICPPFVFLSQVSELIVGSRVALGAQNVSERDQGAFTGEISAKMLGDFGCTYAIVGHSERRAVYGETDKLVAAKFKQAHGAGLRPILCVGETLDERESGETEGVIARQLGAVMAEVGAGAFGDGVIAYEPVWAIGTGETATPEMADEVHAFIRGQVAAESVEVAGQLRILYGGSVKSSNAEALFAMPEIDGGLIGGASLQADEFLAICTAAVG